MKANIRSIEQSVRLLITALGNTTTDRLNKINEIARYPCCASGARSGNAVQYLASCGIECENGGGWMEVNYKLQLSEVK